jgi:H+/Cl- antiporter ClcA
LFTVTSNFPVVSEHTGHLTPIIPDGSTDYWTYILVGIIVGFSALFIGLLVMWYRKEHQQTQEIFLPAAPFVMTYDISDYDEFTYFDSNSTMTE